MIAIGQQKTYTKCSRRVCKRGQNEILEAATKALLREEVTLNMSLEFERDAFLGSHHFAIDFGAVPEHTYRMIHTAMQ